MTYEENIHRFNHVSDFYRRYRPSYPDALFDFLLKKGIIGDQKKVADVGSGTGLFTKCLLQRGTVVYALEPNQAMRAVAEQDLGHYPSFTSINGTAEQTGLPTHSMDAVSAATAFHWFDLEACAREFRRILKPEGWVMLIWNLRWPEFSPILQGYEEILQKHCPKYQGIPSKMIAEEKIKDFFGTAQQVEIQYFPYEQQFDLEGLIGRLRSTSYALTADQLGYENMIADVIELFNKYQINNQITFPYRTKLYLGH